VTLRCSGRNGRGPGRLAGLHVWTEDDVPNIARWGIASFSPDDLRATTRPLLDWLGAEPGGLTSAQARRIVADIDAASDVVGFTIAEFFPRQVMHLQQILDGFPLISGTATVHRVR
jgi:arginase